MSIRKFYSRATPVNLLKLRDEIVALTNPASDVSNYVAAQQQVMVILTDEPSPALNDQIQAAITAHDPVDQGEVLKASDYADLLAMAEAGLAQIVNDKSDLQAGITAVNADKVTLTGTPTQAQVLSVVRRILDRELVLYADLDHILTRQDKEIRVLRHLAKQ